VAGGARTSFPATTSLTRADCMATRLHTVSMERSTRAATGQTTRERRGLSMHRSRFRSILGATATIVVVAAALTSAILVTRPGPSPRSGSQEGSGPGAASGSPSPAASAITPLFSRTAAEAAARGLVSDTAREESKLTTWAFAEAYANAVAIGVSNPVAAVPSIEARQVGPFPTPLLLPGETAGPGLSPTAPTQDVWLVAVSGSFCCEEFASSPSPWIMVVYNATTGAMMSQLDGAPGSAETWPAGFESIQDLAS